MLRKISVLLVVSLVLNGCSESSVNQDVVLKNDGRIDTIIIKRTDEKNGLSIDDSLNAMANLMSGIKDSNSMYDFIKSSEDFNEFSKNFDKRWTTFDSTRLSDLRKFRNNEISKLINSQSTLFYPFSGPDILHAQTFFPDAQQYVLIGLEPVGALPDFHKQDTSFLKPYFKKINSSLNAILNFSFFRTESMKNDLKNEEVDGTLHLLFLFLKRTGSQLSSAKPVTIDEKGQLEFLASFSELKKINNPVKGVEIQFVDKDLNNKKLYYYSLNAADGALNTNEGFMTYLNGLGTINTYLKGASYLMHKSYFSLIRNVILNQSQHVIQDDSGIAYRYFINNKQTWKFDLFGQYEKPIRMFSNCYQADLDSLYKKQGSKPTGFGIGYNFKDKNSNLLIATIQK